MEELIPQLLNNEVFDGYGLYAWEDDDTNIYIESQNIGGKWIIMKILESTGIVTYASGDSAAATAWTDRASQTYQDYATEF